MINYSNIKKSKKSEMSYHVNGFCVLDDKKGSKILCIEILNNKILLSNALFHHIQNNYHNVTTSQKIYKKGNHYHISSMIISR